ncbi:MAG: PIN domain-containing protein [Oligoflexia bacterium]|nr:PIN domain-containing protein [Oligoflexia bacterium]
MIAADTSAWIDYSKGVESRQALILEGSLGDGTLVMPTPVFFEILSGPGLTQEAKILITELPKLDILPGFWERAGDLRRTLLKKGLKARSMDCLIAQNCIDHQVALIAIDLNYRHFAKAGLRLAG